MGIYIYVAKNNSGCITSRWCGTARTTPPHSSALCKWMEIMFKKSALVTTIMLYSPIILGIFGSLIATSPRFMVLSIYSVGLLLFLVAKVSNFRKGIWISFGSRGMSQNYRLLYRTGYAFIILSVALSAALLIVQRI